jgi:hypothetical protein
MASILFKLGKSSQKENKGIDYVFLISSLNDIIPPCSLLYIKIEKLVPEVSLSRVIYINSGARFHQFNPATSY